VTVALYLTMDEGDTCFILNNG